MLPDLCEEWGPCLHMHQPQGGGDPYRYAQVGGLTSSPVHHFTILSFHQTTTSSMFLHVPQPVRGAAGEDAPVADGAGRRAADRSHLGQGHQYAHTQSAINYWTPKSCLHWLILLREHQFFGFTKVQPWALGSSHFIF